MSVVLVDLHQHIEQVAEDMPGTHAGVDALDVLRLQGGVFPADGVKLRPHISFLLRLVQIIFPLGFQGIVGMPLQPQTAQAILYHIADDPVRGENLSFFWQIVSVDFKT